ncbi:unnamed protein product [Ixodes pacificus]
MLQHTCGIQITHSDCTTSPRLRREAPGWCFRTHGQVPNLQGSKCITSRVETSNTEQFTGEETRLGERCCHASFVLSRATNRVTRVLSINFIGGIAGLKQEPFPYLLFCFVLLFPCQRSRNCPDSSC